MKRTLSLILFLLAVAVIHAREWLPYTDSNGKAVQGLEYTYVDQPDDYAGKVRCTVIRSTRELDECNPYYKHRAILYIHGYNDYFFQEELPEQSAANGWGFYALELRKYGHSILPGNKLFQARDLGEYFPDIEAALDVMREDGIDAVVIMAHSTGGLIASYFMEQQPSPMVRAMILNSPFLEWNMSAFMRKVLIPVVGSLASHFPGIDIPQGGGSAYAESLLKDYHGEWEYNTEWKRTVSQPVESGWVAAIDRAQKSIKEGCGIGVPILLLHSVRSVNGADWTPEHQSADAVLNVDDISRIGSRLSMNVTEVALDGALHDVLLSRRPVRTAAYDVIFQWLKDGRYALVYEK